MFLRSVIVNRDKLMIVDGNSILNRAYYALQGAQLLATKDGVHTNAVYGFINILNKYLEEENPEYLCVAFDLRAPTFRHREFDGYKAHRKGMPDELASQVPLIKEVLDAMNIKRLEFEGYEADDIIGSVSLRAEKSGKEVVILTGDRDSLQLVSGKTRVKIPTTKAGKTVTEEYDSERILEDYGVAPAQLADVKGLMGDSSDNIPGVPGIGEKTALELIKKFGSIEKLYENIRDIEKESLREKLESSRESAFLSKRMALVERNMPSMCELEELKRKRQDDGKLYEIFKRLEFKTLIERFNLSPAANYTPASDEYARCIIKEPGELDGLKSDIISAKKLSMYFVMDRTGRFSSELAGVAVTPGEGRQAYIGISERISEEVFLDSFKGIFENGDIKKYGHDMKSAIVFLKRKGIDFKGLAFDTMIAAYIINPSRETYTVSELCGEYLGIRAEPVEELTGKGKNYAPYKDIPAERLAYPAVVYSDAIMKLWRVLDGIINGNGQRELYYDIELPLIEVLSDMEHHGFKVDENELKRFSAELEEKIGVLTDGIFRLAGEEFNINSTKQLGAVLFEKLGLPVIKRTKTGFSTDAEVLEQLAPMHEIVSMILEYRQMMKLKATYAEGLLGVINPVTGRVHSSFNQTVTVTGRISSAEPNLQNIPVKLEMGKKIRKAFVPENEDFILADADYSQIELRVLAHITGDENLISAFENDEDIHTLTASKVFRVPKEDVTPLLRSRAKAMNFGIIYGIGDFSLSKDLGITRKEAKRYIDEYLDTYPKVRLYMKEIVEMGKNAGYVTTLFNRRRYLPELKSDNFTIRSFGERIAMNMPIQGSAADIIKIAMVKVFRRLSEENLKSRLILQVHDELIVETFKGEREKATAILKECMENAVKLKVPLKVDVKCGSSWYDAK